jgi:AcrR family transcriptional regulator
MSPTIGGHEGSGVVAEVGDGVSGLAPGDHVVTSFVAVCGRCRWCASGMEYLCDTGSGTLAPGMPTDGTFRHHTVDGRNLGHVSKIGAFAEHTVVAADSLVKIDRDFPLVSAALLACAVPTGYGSAARRANIRGGDTAVVIGAGGIGTAAIQGARISGASLYHYFPNKSELLKATVREIDEIALPRLRAAAARADDVIGRLGGVLDESDRLMREYPHLAAFDRAMRAESTAHPRGGRPRYPGLKALRDIINDVIEDARERGELPADTDPRAAINAIYALARGLTDRAANLPPDAYAATLGSAKELLRGTLFAPPANRRASTPQRRSARDP